MLEDLIDAPSESVAAKPTNVAKREGASAPAKQYLALISDRGIANLLVGQTALCCMYVKCC